MKNVKSRENKFISLIENNQGIIHKISLLYSDKAFEKEDLFQEICLQLWRSYDSFNSESKFSTWMYRVALNTAINYLRTKSRGPDFEALSSSHQIMTLKNQVNEDRLLVFQAVSKLNKIDKAIILLWLEGETYEDIANIIGISKSNVSVKLVRIKRNIEDIINGLKR